MPDELTSSNSTNEAAAGDAGATVEVTNETPPDLEAEAAKWKALSRKHEAQSKANADAAKRLAAIEESQKSDQQKLAEAQKTAETRADAAEARATRYEVALEKSVPAKLMKFLTGTTREEIEASADELLEAVSPDTGQSGEAGGKPRERLKAGAANVAEPEETDPAKLAAMIPRGYGNIS